MKKRIKSKEWSKKKKKREEKAYQTNINIWKKKQTFKK